MPIRGNEAKLGVAACLLEPRRQIMALHAARPCFRELPHAAWARYCARELYDERPGGPREAAARVRRHEERLRRRDAELRLIEEETGIRFDRPEEMRELLEIELRPVNPESTSATESSEETPE